MADKVVKGKSTISVMLRYFKSVAHLNFRYKRRVFTTFVKVICCFQKQRITFLAQVLL